MAGSLAEMIKATWSLHLYTIGIPLKFFLHKFWFHCLVFIEIWIFRKRLYTLILKNILYRVKMFYTNIIYQE